MLKPILASLTTLLGVALAAILQPPHPSDGPPPPHEAAEKKKGPPGPEGDLRRAFELLRKLRADSGTSGRSEDKLRDWTDRAADIYRKGVKSLGGDDRRLAHEYGTAAHDLARAVDHARNAALFDHPDPDLPPPPEGRGPGHERERTLRDLRHAFDRVEEARGDDSRDARYYLDAARDLYRAARRDAEAERFERAGELARAAEAMTHVPEHLAHAERRDDAPPPPEPKERPEPRKGEDRPDRPGNDLPPPL